MSEWKSREWTRHHCYVVDRRRRRHMKKNSEPLLNNLNTNPPNNNMEERRDIRLAAPVKPQPELVAPQPANAVPVAPVIATPKPAKPTKPAPAAPRVTADILPALSINWAIIGAGGGGGKIAQRFQKFGYFCGAINTARQDIDAVSLANKLVLDYTIGGAGQDLDLGAQAAVHGEDMIKAFIDKYLGSKCDGLVVTVTMGGGTGGPVAVKVVELAQKYKLPIIVICTLPMSNEGAITKNNSLQVLHKLAGFAQKKQISGLVIVDNSKIEQIYPSVSAGQFWDVANDEIADTFHAFNALSVKDSKYLAFDPTDYGKLVTTGGCMVYGRHKVANYMDETSIAEAMIRDVEKGLLAGGFDLAQTINAGVLITGSKQVLDKVPAVNINYAFSMLNQVVGNSAGVYRGIYAVESADDSLMIYSLFAGLGLPQQRLEQLSKETSRQMSDIDQKNANKARFNMAEQEDRKQTQEVEVYRQIEKRNAPLGQLLNRRRSRG